MTPRDIYTQAYSLRRAFADDDQAFEHYRRTLPPAARRIADAAVTSVELSTASDSLETANYYHQLRQWQIGRAPHPYSVLLPTFADAANHLQQAFREVGVLLSRSLDQALSSTN